MSSDAFDLNPVEIEPIDSEYRVIKTSLPVPESIPLLEQLYSLESRAMHGQIPIVWDKAKDFQIWDKWGNCWIDLTSTIFVANAGHGNPKICDELDRLIKKPLLHTYTYAHESRVEFLNYLIQNTPKQFEKAFMLSAGTEAVEAAFKLMRLKGQQTSPKKMGVITLEGNWHGRTMGAQFLGGNKDQKEWIGFDDPYIYQLPFPYPWREDSQVDPDAYFEKHMLSLLKKNQLDPEADLCGFMIETFQGWGAWFYPPEFIKAIERFAKKNNMLVAFDEMQAGFGRTGTLFGYEHYGVSPDLLCLGKGASSSLPLSIVLGSAEVMDLPDIGSMSSTHSANPMACAAGLANMKALLEEGLIENSSQLGLLFHERLANIKNKYSDCIAYVTGKGLLAALIFQDTEGNPLSDFATAVVKECLHMGVLTVHTGRESIKLAPPLSITQAPLEDALDVLEIAIKRVYSQWQK